MKILKRILCLALAVILLTLALAGCKTPPKDKKISIVCTVFPIYDWARNILGDDNDDISLKLLVKNGTDPHSYSPTPRDIVEISSCDMLIYVGGESDSWISDVLHNSALSGVREVGLLSLLGERAVAEEEIEGAECGEDCHDHDHDHGDHRHQENAYDEHVWLSLKNAELLCGAITDELCRLLPQKEESYRENSERYVNEIRSLDEKYSRMAAESARDTLIFADRFPFRYLVEDYGLKYFAAFSGCSADSEASVETVIFLAKKIDELSLSHLIILENSGTALADTVISSTKSGRVGILRLDSMQSITAAGIEDGVSYLSIMENNLTALRTALT